MGLPCQAIHVAGSWVFVCSPLLLPLFFFFFFSWSGVLFLYNPLHTIRTLPPGPSLEPFAVSDAVSGFAVAAMACHSCLLPSAVES